MGLHSLAFYHVIILVIFFKKLYMLIIIHHFFRRKFMNLSVILAAGEGSRTGLDLPKQFYQINNKTILSLCLEKFEYSLLTDGFIVACHPDYYGKTLEIAGAFKKSKGVVYGGKTRQESVFNSLKFINETFAGTDLVAVHDSARPFITSQQIDDLYSFAAQKGSVIPVEEESYTVSLVENERVLNYLDRKQVCRHQTPQIFDFERLFSAYQKNMDCLKEFTDDGSIYMAAGNELFIKYIPCDNLKITSMQDVLFAEYMLRHNSNKEEKK